MKKITITFFILQLILCITLAGAFAEPSQSDKILQKMESWNMSTEEKKQFLINQILSKKRDESMSVQDTMRLQLELHQLNLQTEMTTKAGGNEGQGIQELFKNQ